MSYDNVIGVMLIVNMLATVYLLKRNIELNDALDMAFTLYNDKLQKLEYELNHNNSSAKNSQG